MGADCSFLERLGILLVEFFPSTESGGLSSLLSLEVFNVIAFLFLVLQLPAFFILISRLLKGPSRRPPVEPSAASLEQLGSVSIVVPTLNEAERVSPCLEGLTRQSYEVREIIIVDSNSTDGTPELVKSAQSNDPRFRLINDDPLPAGWVGRPWALQNGFWASSEKSEWFLGVDADTQPQPGLVAGLVAIAQAEKYDLISLSPQFILESPGEWWLQPALLMTLLYRFDPAGVNPDAPERVMANGQCFLCRRSVLDGLEGYSSAAGSFCDDVTLARNIASAGYKVGFMDGAKVLKVRMYEGFQDTWNGWGRSLDLKDACSPVQLWGDLWLLLCTQGLPLFLSLLGLGLLGLGFESTTLFGLTGLNLLLVLIRWALLIAIAPSYEGLNLSSPASWLFYLSPFADPLAVLRIFLSAQGNPKQWRGRIYQ